jgi:hypothetical protein
MGQSQQKHPQRTRLHYESLVNRIQYRFLNNYHPDDPIRQDALKQAIVTELVWLMNRHEKGESVREWYLMERLKGGIKLRGRKLTQWQKDKMYDLLRLVIQPDDVFRKADVIYETKRNEL